MRPLRAERLGRVAYEPMLARQQERHRQVTLGEANDTLFILEHEPVITLGRKARPEHVLLSRAALALRGVDLIHTGRGGDVTYHGPGQLVGYPIVALQEHERDIKRYAFLLEEIMIQTLVDFSISAERIEGLRGVWVEGAKIGAIGVRVTQWTTLHGFALNITTDSAPVDGFALIVPCGITDRPVTSMQRLLAEPPPFDAVAERVIVHARAVLHRGQEVTNHTLPGVTLGATTAQEPLP